MKEFLLMIAASALLLLFVLFFRVADVTLNASKTRPCSEYGIRAISFVPARCYSYWKNK